MGRSCPLVGAARPHGRGYIRPNDSPEGFLCGIANKNRIILETRIEKLQRIEIMGEVTRMTTVEIGVNNVADFMQKLEQIKNRKEE